MKSRRALRLAYAQLEILEETEGEHEVFLDAFISAIAMIRNVGSVIDSESKGNREHSFATWWDQTAANPLYRCIKEVRDLTFKRLEDRVHIKHEVNVTTAVATGTAYNPTVRISDATQVEVSQDGRVVETREVRMTAEAEAESGAQDTPTYSRRWMFSGGQCDGQELLPALHQFLDWMRDDVIPEAERRTVST